MRGDAGKEIVNPEEKRDQQDHPDCGRHRRERLGITFRNPLDESDLVQARRQREQ